MSTLAGFRRVGWGFLVAGLITATSLSIARPLQRVDYLGFTLGLDPAVSPEYQPGTTQSFTTPNPKAQVYHRGHLVAANHLDYSTEAIRQSHFMTTVLPMTRTLNTGAWPRTEVITECYRDQHRLQVIGGGLWKRNRRGRANDHFIDSHHIRTPDQFWKRVIRDEREVIAWLLPNDESATYDALDRFLVTPLKLKRKAGISLAAIPRSWRGKRPATSWPIPEDCDSSCLSGEEP